MNRPHHSAAPTMVADVGATHLRVGTVDSSAPAAQQRAQDIVGEPASVLAQLVRQVMDESSSTVLVVGTPGLVSTDGTVGPALYSRISHVDLRSRLAALIPELSSLTVMNDAGLLAAGVATLARTSISDSHLHIVTGTAIGGALLFDGELHLGAHGFAGEIGHVRSGLGADLCPCGQVGCVDLLASGWSLEADLGPEWWTRPTTSADADRLALAAQALAGGITACHQIVDLESFSISGRLVTTVPWLGDLICESLTTYPRLRYIDASGWNHWYLATAGAQSLLEIDRLTGGGRSDAQFQKPQVQD